MNDFCSLCRATGVSRGTFLKGLGAAAAVAALPKTAFADAHDQERQIGQQVYSDLRKQNQIVDVSPYYPVLRDVGQRIYQASGPQWYRTNFVVVKGNQANAFSVPGGWIYVNEALLAQAENEEELANVVGHETGHLVLGHVMDRIHKAQTANIVGGILSIFIHSQGTFNLLNFLGSYAFLNFSRAQEYQADHEGVLLAGKANYNPYGMIWFFQKLEKLYGNSGFEQYVQDHPATSDRISRLEQFFQSDRTDFARWTNKMTTTAGLPRSNSSTDSRLVLVNS